MFRYWHHLLMLSAESQCVIMLRTIRLAGGGPTAMDEAWRILTEKAAATAELPQHALNATSPLALFVDYRRTVRSNLRRLAAGGDGHEGKSA